MFYTAHEALRPLLITRCPPLMLMLLLPALVGDSLPAPRQRCLHLQASSSSPSRGSVNQKTASSNVACCVLLLDPSGHTSTPAPHTCRWTSLTPRLARRGTSTATSGWALARATAGWSVHCGRSCKTRGSSAMATCWWSRHPPSTALAQTRRWCWGGGCRVSGSEG
eukprot:365358-Chlamydomonas_euryale.AAC.8